MDDPKKATSIYDFTAKDIDGNEVSPSNVKLINVFFLSGEPLKIQGTCLCHRQCGLQVRKDRRELQVRRLKNVFNFSSHVNQLFAGSW